MSNTIDQRVVQMQFDNAQFERETRKSMSTIEQLTKKLNLLGTKTDTVGDFKMDKSTSSMAGFGEAVNSAYLKFSKLDAIMFGFLSKIGENLVSKTTAFVKSLSVDQVTAGWTKYAQKTTAVQTIMSATAKQFDDTGKQMAYVNEQLGKLNWFTDETSYNFVDMVDNIGKFTNNNVPLDKAVISMEGIATWAAASGAGAQQASRAMYNLSQALGMGSVRLQDWMSIENAQMATVEFKETVMETAAELGVLKKQADGTFKTLKNNEVTVENFRNTLSEGWFTSDVLTGALSQYGEFTEKLNAAYEETGLTTSRLLSALEEFETGSLDMGDLLNKTGTSAERLTEIFSELSDSEYALGKKAFKAAQESKTFSDAINATMDAVSTGWMNTFELIFGDYEEAKKLWTDVTEVLYDTFASSGEVRNEILRQWKDLGGRDILLTSFWNTLDALDKVIAPIKDAFRDIFPAATGKTLVDLTMKLWDFSRGLLNTDHILPDIKKTFKGFFAFLDIGRMAIKGLFGALAPLGDIFKTIGERVLGFTGDIGGYLVELDKSIRENKTFENSFKFITKILDGLSKGLSYFLDLLDGKSKNMANFFKGLKERFTDLKHNVGKTLTDLGIKLGIFKDDIKSTEKPLAGFGSKIQSAFAKAFEKIKSVFSNTDFGQLGDILNTGILTSIIIGISKFVNSLSSPIKSFSDLISAMKSGVKSIGGVFDTLAETLANFQIKVKADAIRSIAISIGILTGALVVLSFIDSAKLTSALLGLATVMGLIVGFVAALNAVTNSLKGAKQLQKVSFMLIKLATAILILAMALKIIGSMDLAGVGKGLLGVGALLGMVLAFAILAKNVSRGSAAGLRAVSKNLFGIAVAVLLLAAPIKILGQMKFEELGQGLLAVGALLLAIAGFMKIVNGVKIKGNGLGIVLIAASMLIFTAAIKQLGKNLSKDELLQGEIAIGAMLGILAVFLLAMNTCNKIGRSAGALVSASVAILLLAGAIAAIASIKDSEAAYHSVLAISLALAAMVIALNSAKKGLAGAAALAILSTSLLALIPTFLVLGNLKWEQLGKGFVAIAGSIIILGLAAKILKPVIPAMLGLSAALLLFGAGTALIGVGLISISAGLTALATSITTSGLVIVTGITAILTAIINLIPTVAVALANGVVSFVSALGSGISQIISAVVNILTAILTAARTVIPMMVEVGMEILTALLTGIASNIGNISAAVGTIIAGLLNGLATYVPMIVDAGVNLAVSLINGLANGIREHAPEFLAAVRNLASSAVETLLTVFQDIANVIFGNTAFGEKISGFFESAKQTVREALAPESFEPLGEEAAVNYANGLLAGQENVNSALAGYSSAAENSAADVGVAATEGLAQFASYAEAMKGTSTDAADEFIGGLVNKTSDAKTAGEGLANAGADGADSNYGQFVSAGEFAGGGFVDGLAKKSADAYASGVLIGSQAAAGIRSALDIASPSKLTRKFGVFTGEGLILGMRSEAKDVQRAGKYLGVISADGIASALQLALDAIQNGTDFDPTIRPVIDLSDVNEKAMAINSLFAKKRAIEAQASFVNTTSRPSGSTEYDTDSPSNITFNQYNNSPKALSRLEIYRQTKNQLSMMKGVVKKA